MLVTGRRRKTSRQRLGRGLRRRGFTLIETIVVLVLIGVVLGIVLPRLGYVPRRIRVRQATRRISTAFHMASSMAVCAARPVTAQFDFEAGRIRLEGAEGGQGEGPLRPAGSDEDQDPSLRSSLFRATETFDLPADVSLNENALPVTDDERELHYTFYPNGEASGPRLPLLIAKQAFVVDVDRLTGRPLLHEDDQ